MDNDTKEFERIIEDKERQSVRKEETSNKTKSNIKSIMAVIFGLLASYILYFVIGSYQNILNYFNFYSLSIFFLLSAFFTTFVFEYILNRDKIRSIFVAIVTTIILPILLFIYLILSGPLPLR